MEFTFERQIETGPISMTVRVTAEYTPAGQVTGPYVEYLMCEFDEADMTAVPGLIPALRKWAEDTIFLSESFRQEMMEEARKQGLDKYDMPERGRYSGMVDYSFGYARI